MIDCYMYVGMYQGAHGSPARGLRGRFHFHHGRGRRAARARANNTRKRTSIYMQIPI